MTVRGDRVGWRAAFALYAAAIFTLTHTPGVQVGGKVRIDLVVHLGVFGLWAVLFAACSFFGPAFSWRNIRLVWPIAAVYAAIDESLQAIPFIRRHAAFDDWVANFAGVSLACIAMLVLGRMLASRAQVSKEGRLP